MEHSYEINPELTGISLAYFNKNYIADKVFKRAKVTAENFKYRKWEKGAGLTVPNTLLGATGIPNSINAKSKLYPESVEAHGLTYEIPVTEIEAAEKQGKNVLATKTKFLIEAISAAREARLAKLLGTASNYNGNTQTLAANEKITKSDVNAVNLIEDIASDMLVRPNTIIMNKSVSSKLRRNPAIVKAVHANSGDEGIVSLEQLKGIFEGIENIYVGESVANTAKRGETPNLQQTWGNNIILAYIDPMAEVDEGLTFGLTAEYEERVTGTFFDPKPGVKGITVVKTTEQLKDLIMCADCGYLLKDVI